MTIFLILSSYRARLKAENPPKCLIGQIRSQD